MKFRNFFAYVLIFIIFGLGLVLVARSNKTRLVKSTTVNVSSKESTSFSQEPVSVDKDLLQAGTAKTKANNPPVRIVIPGLSIDLPVREARVIDGYWEVFPDVAGFGLGSAYPDEFGNQVIFAHARQGLFLNLKDAKVGQTVYVFTKSRWYSYRIAEIKSVWPNQTEVISPTPDQTLTLFTCTGFMDTKRFIVVAKRI